jgi:hypothetical protein
MIRYPLIGICPACSFSSSIEVVTTKHELASAQEGTRDEMSTVGGIAPPAERGPEKMIHYPIDLLNRRIEGENEQAAKYTLCEDGVKKVEEANKALMKFITRLTFTGPVERIMEKTKKSIAQSHEVFWEAKTHKTLLELLAAAGSGDWDAVERSMTCIDRHSKNFKGQIQDILDMAMNEMEQQCEKGVDSMFEDLEETSA